MAIVAILIRFKAHFLIILTQIRDFPGVPYLPFFDFESNKGLCPLFKSPLFGVSTVFKVPLAHLTFSMARYRLYYLAYIIQVLNALIFSP